MPHRPGKYLQCQDLKLFALHCHSQTMPIDSSKILRLHSHQAHKLSAKQQAHAREASAMCEWPDCKNKGPHRAAQGPDQRQGILATSVSITSANTNQSYNFFQGMNADAVARYQKDALTGHRPDLEDGRQYQQRQAGQGSPEADRKAPPIVLMFSELNGRALAAGPRMRRPRSKPARVFNAERKRCR